MRLIDADAAIEALKQCEQFYVNNMRPMIDRENMIEVISNLPTIQPQTGHWIYHPEYEEDGGCCYECSECGMGHDYDSNYCSRCGAKMEGAYE